jgi:uncharacterized alkaline shock family protein YloU
MGKYLTTEALGNIQISDDVITAIVSLAASEVEGVASIGSKPSTIDIKDIIGKKGFGKSVRVDISNNLITIDADITIVYGKPIATIAEKVQHAIRDAVSDATGMDVDKVNIHICGIVFPKTKDSQKK